MVALRLGSPVEKRRSNFDEVEQAWLGHLAQLGVDEAAAQANADVRVRPLDALGDAKSRIDRAGEGHRQQHHLRDAGLACGLEHPHMRIVIDPPRVPGIAGATVLGRVTIGRGASIGGNVWVTHYVPPGAHVTQARSRKEELMEGGWL